MNHTPAPLATLTALTHPLPALFNPSSPNLHQAPERWWVWFFIVLLVLFEISWFLCHSSYTKRKHHLEPIGEIPHKPHYDVRVASQNYSNIATVLAGFAFTAVILVLETDIPDTPANAATLRDWAAIAFLVAFLGSISSAFTFSVVTGEEILAPRSHAMALLAGSGLSVASVFVFWGLAILTSVFLSPSIAYLARCVFYAVVGIAPLYLILSALDPILAFDQQPVERPTWLILLAPSYLPILAAIVLKEYASPSFIGPLTANFNVFVLASLLITVLSAVLALFVSNRDYLFRITPPCAALWIFIHSLVLATLLLLLPNCTVTQRLPPTPSDHQIRGLSLHPPHLRLVADYSIEPAILHRLHPQHLSNQNLIPLQFGSPTEILPCVLPLW